MIGIINYGSGNIQAIANIYKRLNIPYCFVTKPEDLKTANKVILPGVGAFDQAITELHTSGLRNALDDHVLRQKKDVLGICVGMQLLARRSEEGTLEGLGWVDGIVKRFDLSNLAQQTRLPHMGWNNVEPIRSSRLFDDVGGDPYYYFLHSYYFVCDKPVEMLAMTEYGVKFASAINSQNIYGVQFHPEKSHQSGIQLLKNFAKM